MKLSLAAVPNADYPRGHWNATIKIAPRQIDVSDIEDARQACWEFIRNHELGGGNWPSDAGVVSDAADRVLGRFSYNLRFWPSA